MVAIWKQALLASVKVALPLKLADCVFKKREFFVAGTAWYKVRNCLQQDPQLACRICSRLRDSRVIHDKQCEGSDGAWTGGND